MNNHPCDADPDKHTDEADASADNLLDELESIKDLLEESERDDEALQDDLNIDIPILDDIVGNKTEASSDLLDLRSIFDDTAVDDLPSEPETSPDLDFSELDTDIDIPSFKLDIQTDGPATEDPQPSTSQAETAVAAPPLQESFPDAVEPDSPNPETQTPPAPSDADAASPDAAEEPIDLDLLVQEIVDEMMPTLEDQLRRRLRSYPAELIRQLAERTDKT